MITQKPAILFLFRNKIIANEVSAVMNEMKKNSNIKCTVSQCRNNMVTEDYCCLDCIHVGTHETDPTVPECVDCNSFVRRTDGMMD